MPDDNQLERAMERFDSSKALNEHRLKLFGQTALAIAKGRGSAADAAAFARAQVDAGAFYGEVLPLLRPAQDAAGKAMRMRSAIVQSTDSGLVDEWGLVSQAFAQDAVAAMVVGRLRGVRRVPFTRGVLSQSLFGAAEWVAETTAKPVATAGFEFLSVPSRKIALLAVMSMEALDTSGAEMLVRQSLKTGAVQRGDATFASSDAEVTGESPAGIGADAVTIASTGSTAAAISADVRSMIDAKVGKVSLDTDVWIMSPQAQAFLRMLKITDADGSLAGFPVVASSAADGQILLLSPSYVFLASGPITLNVSTEANVTIDGTVYSLYQRNLVGIVSEFYLNWALSGSSDSNGHYAAVKLSEAAYA